MENAMTKNNQNCMEQFVEKFCEMVSSFMKSGKAAEYEKKTATTLMKFTPSDCIGMDEHFKNDFEATGLVVFCSKTRTDTGYEYALRYRSNAYTITVKADSLLSAKMQFIKTCQELRKGESDARYKQRIAA